MRGLDELMPHGDWKASLAVAENKAGRPLTPDERKEILVGAFSESLRQLGGYDYVAETTVLRPLSDRPLYCLRYATRHEKGLAVFRDCQIAALNAQASTRAAGKIRHEELNSGQGEFFQSLHEMGPDKTAALLEQERKKAAGMIMELARAPPGHVLYREVWPAVLMKHVVRLTDVNSMCGDMRKSGALLFPDWEPRRRVPQDHYRMHRKA